MLLSTEGDESVGKSTLALSAPLPIVSLNFDMGWERAIKGAKHEMFDGLDINVIEYDRGKVEPDPVTADITIYELPRPIQLDSEQVRGAKELWGYFLIRIGAAFTDPRIRSVVVDTMTVARRIKADAHLQKLQEDDVKQNKTVTRKQLIQIEYGAINDAVRDIWNTAAGVRKNFVGIHHLTDERMERPNSKGEVVSMLTGNKILEGLNNTYRFVDIAMRMEKERGEIKAKFIKFGYSLGLEGSYTSNPTWDSIVDVVGMSSGDRLQIERRNGTGG